MSPPTFFKSAVAFRKWLEKNHDHATELLVGFPRVESGKGGLTYREALDQALCFGWIDGVRKRYCDSSYTVRFSRRDAGSIWSVINTNRIEELIRMGCALASGMTTFTQRDKKKSKLYSYEVGNCRLALEFERRFRTNPTAWEFYQLQAPCYPRVTCHWVMSAKQEETSLRRLDRLIADSAHKRRVKQLISNPTKPA